MIIWINGAFGSGKSTTAESENSWSEQQMDRCLEAFSSSIKGKEINTNDLSATEVVDVILKSMETNGGRLG